MLLWAMMQIALPTVAVIADAHASADGLTAHAHVEDKSRGACVQVHGSDCVLCQYLSGLAAPGNCVRVPAEIALAIAQPARALVQPGAIALRGLPSPRAPPVRVG